VRPAGLLVVTGLMAAACTGTGDGQDGLRSFDLDGQESTADPWSDARDLSAEWGALSAVVVEAPEVVTAGEDLDVVIEVHNPAHDALSVDPCPTWSAGYEGENTGLATTLAGELPCDQIERFEARERIQLRLTIPSPTQVDCEDGGDPLFTYLIEGSDGVRASIRIPMREHSSAPTNDCGGATGRE